MNELESLTLLDDFMKTGEIKQNKWLSFIRRNIRDLIIVIVLLFFAFLIGKELLSAFSTLLWIQNS